MHEPGGDEDPVLWRALGSEDVLRRLEVDPRWGLSEDEAARRRLAHGQNEIERDEGFSWPAALARQIADPLVVVLLAAAAISGAVGDVIDAAAIAAIVAMNGLLGFVQEWRAEKTLAALASMLAPTARIIREGRRQTISATELTPGDLVDLAQGDRVPADIKVLKASEATLDESSLTGEARAVAKRPGTENAEAPLAERASMLHAGSLVASGRLRGVVVAVGRSTEFGRIALSAAKVRRPPTPLQKRLEGFARVLGLGAVGLGLVVVLLGLVGGRAPVETVMIAASLAVAAVPEGLPAVVALSLAVGVRALARRNALVRRLRAVETLGSATVICTDKTGTLTTGGMSVSHVATSSGDLASPFRAEGALDVEAIAALETAAICSDAGFDEKGLAVGTPTEAALLAAAHAAGVEAARAARRLSEIPFSSERKLMTVVVDRGGRTEAHVKGAPERLIPRCSRHLRALEAKAMTEEERDVWLARASEMARGGLRVIALARRVIPAGEIGGDPETDLELIGLVGMKDPLRPGAREAVETVRAAGARVIMITGDAPETAAAIADDVGLDHDGVVTGAELDDLDDRALEVRLASASVLSRATPHHKLRVVERLQAMGEIVAMTGDGVNDAPALKKADIGVAMGIRGADAAKAAADIILLDDDFSTIVKAMREGRRQDDNIRKFVLFLLTTNVAEVLAVFANVVAGAPLLVQPAQLLWINLVTDGATALALGFEREEPDAMKRPPAPPDRAILDRASAGVCVVFGLVIAIVGLSFFHANGGAGVQVAQTHAFLAFALFPQAIVFSFRSLRAPVFVLGWLGNRMLLAAAAAGVLLQVVAVYVWPINAALETAPLGVDAWLAAGAAGLGFFACAELIKTALWRRSRSRRTAHAVVKEEPARS